MNKRRKNRALRLLREEAALRRLWRLRTSGARLQHWTCRACGAAAISRIGHYPAQCPYCSAVDLYYTHREL